MLVHLDIRDLAIIEHTAISFGDGLNALTGETGAGKSIVVGALDLVLGGRAKSDSVRRGAKRAEVQALFRVDGDSALARRLEDLDLLGEPGPDGTTDFVVRRLVSATGRGRVYVNGGLVTVSTLRDLTRGLVDISSQHEHTALLEAATHLDVLDRFGELQPSRERYDQVWRALGRARSELEALRGQEQDRLAREDYVRFQLAEIDRIAPVPDEDEALQHERERLVHAEKLRSGAREVETALAGRDGSAHELLLGAIRSLDRLTAVDPALQAFCTRLEEARIDLEDIAFEMRRYGDGVDLDPRRLDVVEERLDDLRRLKRKHGLDIPGLLERAAELRTELAAFESVEDHILAATACVEALEGEALTAAEALSAARAEAGARLQARVCSQLTDLAMPQAKLQMHLERIGDQPGPTGLDRAELQIQANPGEGFDPLAKVASGGELSRVLLALKTVLGRTDDVQTAVFDEVDSGVGGAVAEVIGRKLREIAGSRQVITITHLPQIAALADHHLEVAKATDGGRTRTMVRSLEPGERAEELARMLGGVEITRKTRAHAEELLRRGATAG